MKINSSPLNDDLTDQGESVVVGILYPGEMGVAIGALLKSRGAKVATHIGERSESTKRRAVDAGLELLPSLGELAFKSDLILSIVPPGAVHLVAEAYVREASIDAAPFVDLNAKSLNDVAQLSRTFEDASLTFANGCIIGQSSQIAKGGKIYFSGPDCESLRTAFEGVLPVIYLGGDPETATAFKMTFAGFNKTVTAAVFELAIAAHGLGVFNDLIDEVRFQLPGFMTEFDPLFAGYARHVARRADEMKSLASLLAERGLDHRMTEAAAEVFSAVKAGSALQELTEGHSGMAVLAALGSLATDNANKAP